MSLTGTTIQDGGTRERRNITMPSLSSLYFHFILYFNFLFYFILLIPNLKLGTSVMSHVTVTQSHIIWKNIKGSGMIMLYYMSTVYSIYIF